jgi:hypothetical protein
VTRGVNVRVRAKGLRSRCLGCMVYGARYRACAMGSYGHGFRV